jgi:hypothetical protein
MAPAKRANSTGALDVRLAESTESGSLPNERRTSPRTACARYTDCRRTLALLVG